jgi:ABC-type sugar transport system substrate-binding protein
LPDALSFKVARALLLAVLLAGCNREHKKVIAVIPKGNADIFWQSVHAGAVKAGRETGVDILWDGPAK